jgi:hypothetical protein
MPVNQEAFLALLQQGTINCFKHIILICTTYDANNQIVVLAFAILVEAENSEN